MKCFEAQVTYSTPCKKNECRYWINSPGNYNCTILASRDGPMTLQQIGEIFGITRMRVCQIEKKILKKISSFIESEI